MSPPDGPAAPRASRSRGSWFLKAGFSLLLLGFLLYRAHLGTVLAGIAGANAAWIGAAFVFFSLNVLAVSLRWQLLLSAAQVILGLPRVVSFVLVGLFFNNFLPSGMGGDIVRAFDVARCCGDKFRAVSSIVMTRLVGLAASVPIGALSLAWVVAGGYLPRWLAVSLALSLAAEGAGVAFAFSRRAVGWAFRLAVGKGRGKLGDGLGKLHAALAFYLGRRRLLASTMGLALVAQMATVACIACLGRSIGIHLPFRYYLLFTLLIGNVSMLPVSMNGLGVREGGYVILFGAVGVAPSACLSLSLAFLFVRLSFSLLGGLAVALRRGPGSSALEGAARGEAAVAPAFPPDDAA